MKIENEIVTGFSGKELKKSDRLVAFYVAT